MTQTLDAPAADPLGEHFGPLSHNEAITEANRCLFCYDAPCTQACPTHIDIPRFIKKIATGNVRGSALTIYDSNLLGATCARVCPVQELCEGACVLGSDHKPISIGRLQRHAMDYAKRHHVSPALKTAAVHGRVAVIGAGPAGLSCAGELARRGHSVTLYEKRALPGGLSTYGIIALREPVAVSLDEVKTIEGLGVRIETGQELGRNLDCASLLEEHDAVFLGTGLGTTPPMGIEGEEHVLDGLVYIEQSKLNRGQLRAQGHVVVIGAGNTAIDCATIAKRLGADRVTMLYRRTDREMTAYEHEYEFIKKEGVEFRFLTQPVRVHALNGQVMGIECVRMELGEPDASGRAAARPVPESEFVFEANIIIKAVGQEKPSLASLLGLKAERGFIAVNDLHETNVPRVFAGGDAVRAKGSASTVMAVQDGKQAALAISEFIANRKAASNG